MAKQMVLPVTLIFRFLQSKERTEIMLIENKNMRIQGQIVGFDEYMNIVLDGAEEVYLKSDRRKHLGRILLKGDNVALIRPLSQ